MAENLFGAQYNHLTKVSPIETRNLVRHISNAREAYVSPGFCDSFPVRLLVVNDLGALMGLY